MNYEMIMEFIKFGCFLVLGALSLYLNTSAKAQTKAKEIQEAIANVTAKAVVFIKEAEENYRDATNAGGQKFEEVVTRLHALVPAQLQFIITKEMIENIVQSTFDQIEEYVALQLDDAIERVDE